MDRFVNKINGAAQVARGAIMGGDGMGMDAAASELRDQEMAALARAAGVIVLHLVDEGDAWVWKPAEGAVAHGPFVTEKIAWREAVDAVSRHVRMRHGITPKRWKSMASLDKLKLIRVTYSPLHLGTAAEASAADQDPAAPAAAEKPERQLH